MHDDRVLQTANNNNKKYMNRNYSITCIITLYVMADRILARNKKKPMCYFFFSPTYSLMAILSECRDDTDDMLWDIYKEKD